MSLPTTTRRVATLALALGTLLAVSGCGASPWSELEATEGATSSATPKPTVKAVLNDLAAGSTQRQLTAGDANLTVDYSSSLNMGEWTAGANKPISFSLSAALGTDDGQGVTLSKVSLITAVNGPDGALDAPEPQIDSSSVAGGYFMKAPYSYGQTFVLGAIDPAATSVTMSFTYELLIQTTPTSASYAKQTASDTLTIAIAE